MNYKMVFCDIDGTLLDSNHKISPGTREGIRRLDRMGTPFILVSARMPAGIIPLQEMLRIRAPIVCFGGALILEDVNKDGKLETIDETVFEPKQVSQVYRFIQDEFPDIIISFYNKSHWFVCSSREDWIEQERAITGIEPMICDFSRLDSSDFPLHKMLCMGMPDRIEALREVLRERFAQLTVYNSKPTYLEIMAPGVRKSLAMELLAKRHQANLGQTIAIGDNYNDMDMIESAGLGVAMGNAPDEVKAVADLITATNDQDGVSLVIKRCFPEHDCEVEKCPPV